MSTFLITKRPSGAYHFVLKAGNGEVVLNSELYTSKQGCENGIESVKTNSQIDARFLKETAKDGQFYFNLHAANNQIIGTSELYASAQNRDKGITAVKNNAAGAVVKEE